MQSRRFLFSLLTASLFTALLATPWRADAQSITVVNEQSLPRLDASRQQIPKRPVSLSPEGINAQDCRDDQRIRFPVQMTQFQANAVVQVWAGPQGVDCKVAVNRSGMNAACWQLEPGVPLQQTIDVDIPVRKILGPTGDPSLCGTVDLTRIDVSFLMFPPGDMMNPAVATTVTIFADTVGPQPPQAKVTAGNGRARIEVSGVQLGVAAVEAFCEKSMSPSSCAPSSLVAGTPPDPARRCGSIVGSTGTTLFAEPLENGTSHVVAIAARDSFDNVGPLSDVTCTIPDANAEPKSDEDGSASGGGCTTAPRRSGNEGPLGALGTCALAAFALVVVRRRKCR